MNSNAALLAGLVAFTTLACVTPPRIHAQDGQAVVAPREIIPGKVRLSQRLIVLLDVSGSMSEDKDQGGSPGERRLAQALSATSMIVGIGTDDVAIAAIAFSDSPIRWQWVPEEPCNCDLPENWACLPDADAIKSLHDWAKSFTGNGGTLPVGAMSAALREPVRDLSIVLVSDGAFGGDALVEAVRAGQGSRLIDGYGPATLLVIGIGAKSDLPHMRTLGNEGRGGFWLTDGSGVSGPW